jgi:hypothetical protein
MTIWDKNPPLEEDYDSDESILSPLAIDTDRGWKHILNLCGQENASFGFGALDSFLSGADLEKRISLVEVECPRNATLRLALRDTLQLNQSSEWTEEQERRLVLAAGS